MIGGAGGSGASPEGRGRTSLSLARAGPSLAARRLAAGLAAPAARVTAPVTAPFAAGSLAALLGCASACGAEAPSPPSGAAWAAEAYQVDLPPASTEIADLRWRAPARCGQIYRVRIDEEVPAAYERLTGQPAEHSQGFLALGADPLRAAEPLAARPDASTVWQGRLLYWGPRTHDRELFRELFVSGALLGPASPDAACFERTWDPIEDALALGWPRLPARMAAIGEVWTGARVESRCNRSACVLPQTGGGGPEAHHLACVTMSWRERLDGIYELDGRRVASIASTWSDGQEPSAGVWSERVSLVDVDAGRLLASETTIHHGFLGITREIRIEAVDSCPGGLRSGGWRPEDADALEPAITRASAGLTARKTG
ncbi:MAG: hypothetical protein R3B09_09845 [Nannocystaceae bacterium]